MPGCRDIATARNSEGLAGTVSTFRTLLIVGTDEMTSRLWGEVETEGVWSRDVAAELQRASLVTPGAEDE